MSQSIVFVTQSDAVNYGAAIDAKLKVPMAGVDVGGGPHAAPSQSATTTYGAVIKHPTLSSWAYADDGVVQAQAVALPIGATVTTLDATWVPAPGAVVAVG